jgi:hypothetical protein
MSFRAKELFADLTEKLRVTQNDYLVPIFDICYIIAKEARIELIFFSGALFVF